MSTRCTPEKIAKRPSIFIALDPRKQWTKQLRIPILSEFNAQGLESGISEVSVILENSHSNGIGRKRTDYEGVQSNLKNMNGGRIGEGEQWERGDATLPRRRD